MVRKVKKQALEWFTDVESDDPSSVEGFVERVVSSTRDEVLTEIRTHFEEEFKKGNLKHDYSIISPEYYLDLKFKEVCSRLAEEPK